MEPHYGHLLRHLHCCADQAMTGALASMELTAAQGHIMGYIFHQAGAPCPRDIEEAFQLSHPTVSGILSRLEKKGFIEFRPDPEDRRCKRIYVLQKGVELHETMRRTIADTESQLVSGFSEEEKALFRQFLCRTIENLGGTPGRSIHKEEDTK